MRSSADYPELPLDAYELSDRDSERMGQATSRLVQRCMRSYGFADFPLNPRREPFREMGTTFTSTVVSISPYGVLDFDHARRWGYGFDPDAKFTPKPAGPEGRAVTQREHEVLDDFGGAGHAGAVVHGLKVPKGGCTGESSRRLMGDATKRTLLWGYVTKRSEKIGKAVAKDARVRRVFGDWSRCVQDKGFKAYDSPRDAFLDKAWRKGASDGNTARTKRELGTAVADIECNRKLNVAGVWWVVSDEKQRADIRRHAARYEAVRADQERLRGRVREVLGEK
ncbi:hypothetical protein [Streptomyces kanamyceticus]|uniref:hypothetical protein n=1 Tax=Streptomyces kanamyceticus TaxID=1967 RepID=UPI0012FF0D2A|nr:hypothetical protein [Streptomyces kanamyceticus]